MNINIVNYGSGKKPLVLLHGWGFDHRVWLPLVPHLADRYLLFLVDLPGFGLSSAMHWDNFKAIFLSHMPSRFVLAGWSMGGLFATRLALEEPQRISHLLNIASTPCFIKSKHWPGVDQKILTMFYENLSRDPERVLLQFRALQLSEKNSTLDVAGQLPTQQGLKLGLDLLRQWDLRPMLNTLDMPTHYMFGQLDTIVPRHTLTAMQRSYPKFSYFLFPKAAHMPFLSHTDQFIQALEVFLQ